MSGALLITVLAALPVEGDTECPRIEELRTLVARLETPHHARLTQLGPKSIQLTLFAERGDELASKSLEAQSCRALLEAAGATLLAWQAQFPAAQVSARKRVPLPTPATDSFVPSPATAGPAASWRLDLSLTGALVGLSPSAGVVVAGLVGPRNALWKGRLHAVVLLPVEVTAASGSVSSTRPALGFGGTVRLVDALVRLEAGIALEGALLIVWGRGFEQNATLAAFDPGGELSLRASRGFAEDLELFLQLALNLSFVQQSIRVAGIDVVAPLPPFALGLRFGLAFGR